MAPVLLEAGVRDLYDQSCRGRVGIPIRSQVARDNRDIGLRLGLVVQGEAPLGTEVVVGGDEGTQGSFHEANCGGVRTAFQIEQLAAGRAKKS